MRKTGLKYKGLIRNNIRMKKYSEERKISKKKKSHTRIR